MRAFRRFIIGGSQFSMVLIIIGFVIGGAVLGIASRASLFSLMQMREGTVNDDSIFEAICATGGAVAGFFTAAFFAAFLFTLIEIANNSRRTYE